MTHEIDDHAFLRELLGGDGLHGPGDDAALVVGAAERVLTMDGLVAGTHYRVAEASVESIAKKLVQRNFSDLAAMGAWPVHVLASFVFGASDGWAEGERHRFYRAVAREVRARDARWIGGDLARSGGPTVLQLVAVGELPPRQDCTAKLPVTRAGARAGDALCVSGALGGSLRRGRHLDFEARLDCARHLVHEYPLTSMIDLSDGLSLDLTRVLEASAPAAAPLAARVRAEAVPIHEDALAAEHPLEAALHDGEDYELLFTLQASELPRLLADPLLTGVAHIGEIDAATADAGGITLVRRDASQLAVEARGWVHAFDGEAGAEAVSRDPAEEE